VRAFAFLATIVTCVLASSPAAAAPPRKDASAAGASLQRSLLSELNAVRAKAGLSVLRPAAALDAAAASHARSMLDDGFFAHESSNGEPSWVRIARFYALTPDWKVGENLIWRRGRVEAGAVVRAWLESPSHRVNLLSPVWREVGIAALAGKRAPGVYARRSVTLVVVDFGTR
jgi:uncharacterized protein YkwD